MEELDNIIVMHDEDGNEESFEYLDAIEYQGKEYEMPFYQHFLVLLILH